MAFELASIWQPDPAAAIKTRSSPAAFPTTLSLHFFPSTLLIRPPSYLRPRRAPLFPACPLPPPKDTTRPARKTLERDRPLRFARHPRSTHLATVRLWVRLDDDAEERSWISRSPATWSHDGLRCRTSVTSKPPQRINHTSLLPHRGQPRRASTLTSHLATASSFAGLHHGCC
jgi:hypothetical protein